MIPDPFLRERDGADGLVAGYYLLRRADRIDVPIRIWYGPPHDPDTDEVLDRSWRWQIEIYGIDACDPERPALLWGYPVETLDQVWPAAAKLPTTAADYHYRVDRAEYAEQWQPDDPFGTKYGRVDPLQSALPFLD